MQWLCHNNLITILYLIMTERRTIDDCAKAWFSLNRNSSPIVGDPSPIVGYPSPMNYDL